MQSKEIDVVHRFYDSLQKGPGEVLSLLTDDVVYIILGPKEVPLNGEYVGHQGVKDLLSKIEKYLIIDVFKPMRFIGSGDNVSVLFNEQVRLTETKRAYNFEGIHLFTIHKGLVNSVTSFFDTALLAESPAAGQETW